MRICVWFSSLSNYFINIKYNMKYYIKSVKKLQKLQKKKKKKNGMILLD